MPDKATKIVDRIVADNDPRNGSVAARLIRMNEQPDRQPNSEGLYEDPNKPRVYGLAFSRTTSEPLPEPPAHALYDAVDDAVIAALRAAPRARSGLGKVITAAGMRCTPSNDRAVVFCLERLARKGYLVQPYCEGRTMRYHLLAEPCR